MSRDLSQATVHPEKVKPSSAVSRWSMDDADVSSGTITDSWGSNDGTINGATSGASGVGYKGEAFSFDGTDDYVELPSGIGEGVSQLSVSSWIYLDDSTKGAMRIIAHDGATNVFQFLHDGSSDGLTFNINDGSWRLGRSGYLLDTGRWYHAVGVYDRGSINIFLDGSRIYSTSTGGSSTQSPGTPTLVGVEVDNNSTTGQPASNNNYWDGKIDEVRVYNTSLSQQQVWKLYNIGTHSPWRLTRS